MRFRIVKLDNFSGEAASVYSVVLDEDKKTLFDHFISENLTLHKSELLSIIERIKSMVTKTGAREYFFKLNEGRKGDGVCAMYDDPDKRLRLYCIRYGTGILILGGGGEKPGSIRTLQESDKLKKENYLLRDISEAITKRIKEKEIRFLWDNNELSGNLQFDTDEED